MRTEPAVATVEIVRTILRMMVVLGFTFVAAAMSCEAESFFCTDVGNAGFTCYCKVDGMPCGEMGDCMQGCSP